MGLEDLSQATSQSAEATAEGFPASSWNGSSVTINSHLWRSRRGFVFLFLSLTAIAVYGQRSVGLERNTLRNRNRELFASIEELKNNRSASTRC